VSGSTASGAPPAGEPGRRPTRAVVDALYDAFLAGDPDGMLALFADDISLRFLGQVDARGIEQAHSFFVFAAGLLTDVRFRIERKVVDGDRAAVIWSETARTSAGADWANHGVDTIRVEDGRITELHENNDVRLVARHFPAYEPG
jgi:uncharacterized protein (TIGR02246 family)